MKITFIILFTLACLFAMSWAYPQSYTIDRFDINNDDRFEYPRHSDDYRNSRLRRTYYHDDEYHRGYYPSSYHTYNRAPVAPVRREDANIDRALKFTPLVRYKSTHTKRKKLFVPNLWG